MTIKDQKIILDEIVDMIHRNSDNDVKVSTNELCLNLSNDVRLQILVMRDYLVKIHYIECGKIVFSKELTNFTDVQQFIYDKIRDVRWTNHEEEETDKIKMEYPYFFTFPSDINGHLGDIFLKIPNFDQLVLGNAYQYSNKFMAFKKEDLRDAFAIEFNTVYKNSSKSLD